jgi:hypothetical protein
VVETGALTLTLGSAGKPVFQRAAFGGQSFAEGEIEGPVFKESGVQYAALVGEEGWNIVESGPVRVLLQTKGKHTGENGSALDFHIQIYAYAGKPYVQLEYRFINSERAQSMELTGMKLAVRPKTKASACAIGRSNYRTAFQKSAGEPISHLIDTKYLQYTSNEQMPEINFGAYFADWRDGQRGLCVTLYQAFQNFPKGFDVDESGMDVQLIPESWGKSKCCGAWRKRRRCFCTSTAPTRPLKKSASARCSTTCRTSPPSIGRSTATRACTVNSLAKSAR